MPLDGLDALVLAVSEVRGPGHAVCAVLAESKAAGDTFATAWYRAIRALAPPRSAPDELCEAIALDRQALAEIRPYLKAAYEGRHQPSRSELARARRLSEHRLADLAA